MNNGNVGYFYESASERKSGDARESASTFGAYQKEGVCSFDEHFENLRARYKQQAGIDIQTDIKPMLADREFMESYKTDLMKPVIDGFLEMSPNDPHIRSIVENVSKFWDTKVRNYTESASITGYLPIATLEFPVLTKQFFQSILKDIIEVETTKTPNITKHIKTTYMVDNQTGQEYEYPRCLFDGTWEKIWDAGKGHPIKEEVVPLTDGRLWKYDIIDNLTDGVPGMDKLSLQFKIIGVKVGTDVIKLKGNGITIEFSTGGTFVNGDIKLEHNGTTIEDTISGRVNFKEGTVDLSSASGQVEGVIFSGYLSNEKNMRSTSVREKRDILRFTIEDGARWNMPFTIEEIEDAAALLDINYYNRMVDEIVKCQDFQEGLTVIKFLDDEFKKYNGVKSDIYKLESIAHVYTVDIKRPNGVITDPFEYITNAVQFRLTAIMNQIAEETKMEKLSYIIVANPMATQVLNKFTEWKSSNGSSIGGVTVNNSYGFASELGANVRIVATNTYDAYTKEAIVETGNRELVMHIYVYPTTPDHISFRHLKYTSHLLTSQSQTAYQAPNAPGGAYQIVTATSRFKTLAVQGIQARLVILNSDIIYGPAPKALPVVGAPWTN